jgi:hypothetical protein
MKCFTKVGAMHEAEKPKDSEPNIFGTCVREANRAGERGKGSHQQQVLVCSVYTLTPVRQGGRAAGRLDGSTAGRQASPVLKRSPIREQEVTESTTHTLVQDTFVSSRNTSELTLGSYWLESQPIYRIY